MARFVKHTACPKCRENGRDKRGNNLGIYDDGSSYCFSCGYHSGSSVPSTPIFRQPEPERAILTLPDDVEPLYPSLCVDWFNKYDLTVEDLYANKCLWSKSLQRLIFPFYGPNNELLGWQGRYFGDVEGRPKWFGRGQLDNIYHVFNQPVARQSLVITEDVVSAYKVSKITASATMPLFGSHINSKKMLHLKVLSDKIILWLDPDKHKEAIKFSSHLSSISLDCRVVNSEVDPKECSEDLITNLLTNS